MLFGCSNNPNTKYFTKNENEYFEQIKANDVVLGQAKEGDWLYDHKENGQTFLQFVTSKTTKKIDTTSVIYLQPIGKFDSLQSTIIEITKEYLSLFFQRKVEILPNLSDKNIPAYSRRLREDGHEQILAPFILDSVLSKIKTKNSAALMALSEKDLFPNKDWSFVFGLASYKKRVGVTSIYRLQDKILVSSNFTKCLKRLINVSSHEIGHMFSIHHCITSKCVMNGSNSMYETDLGTNRLCSECQQKLCYSLKYNNEKRLAELQSFFKKYNLILDFNYLELDAKSL
jgi:archaemetzincin